MKKIVKTMAVVIAIAMTITMVPAKTQVNAKSKKAVKAKAVCSLKKGTLTISGKGAVPKTKKFRNNGKIKKVVVKKGVTSIPYKTFYKCKNLAEVKFSSTVKNIGIESFYGTKISKVTVPNNVKTIGQGAFGGNKNLKTIKIPGTIKVNTKNESRGIESIAYGSAPEKVYFGEPFKLNTVSYVNGKNYIVSGKNKKYVTKNGMIFTKNEKTLVRVPSETEELNIPQGCEKFALQSILYGTGEGDGDTTPRCNNLKKIVIPETVKSIDTSSYKGRNCARSFEENKEVIINKNLDSKSVISLCNLSNTASLEKVAPQVNCINIRRNVYYNDNIMLAFTMKIIHNIRKV
ncbi:MAG: leucine-rich repeat domain-containing protein [Eubacterium sp.]|uniref:leucine-rich repeat domain-containing protein n=1 Tax=Eubacterium sp. TaxID=142586 RepID=UPI0039940633